MKDIAISSGINKSLCTIDSYKENVWRTNWRRDIMLHNKEKRSNRNICFDDSI